MSEVKQDNRFKRYFKETRAEVRKVHWPTRKEARSLTTVVLVITISMTIFLGVISSITSALASSVFIQQSTLAIAVVGIVAVACVITLAVMLRRQ